MLVWQRRKKVGARKTVYSTSPHAFQEPAKQGQLSLCGRMKFQEGEGYENLPAAIGGCHFCLRRRKKLVAD